jgi:hypothetical protein
MKEAEELATKLVGPGAIVSWHEVDQEKESDTEEWRGCVVVERKV